MPANRFQVPELCNVTALTIVILVSQLFVFVLLFAGPELSWARLALLSLFVQWIALSSAGLLCAARPIFNRLGLLQGAALAFLLVMGAAFVVGLLSDRVLGGWDLSRPFNWRLIGQQLAIAAIITGLVLRYFYVQQRLREQERSELQSRIQALQSRIRPHFLFNSMNIIASLISVDPDTAESVVEDLSALFRASLNEVGNQVRLDEELKLCERYVRIEGLRLGERLDMDWQIEEVPRDTRIPLLTLQPLLENAIYHGIQPLPDGGRIELRLWQEAGDIRVRIVNPIPPSTQEVPVAGHTEGNRMALNNIRSRLQVLYGGRASLETSERDDEFITTLRYPYRSES
ncbi:MAG: sensor histidine kinase [Pseudomonadota bacterium]